MEVVFNEDDLEPVEGKDKKSVQNKIKSESDFGLDDSLEIIGSEGDEINSSKEDDWLENLIEKDSTISSQMRTDPNFNESRIDKSSKPNEELSDDSFCYEKEGKFQVQTKVIKNRNELSFVSGDNFEASKEKKKKIEPSLLMRGVNFLSRREYSEKELRVKLSKYLKEDEGVADIEKVIEKLKSMGYLSNERFAETYARSNSRKKGVRVIQYELSRHNLPREVLEKVLEPIKATETRRAYEIWSRKFTLSHDYKEKTRQYRFLAYRGFGSDAIRKVINGEYSPDDDS